MPQAEAEFFVYVISDLVYQGMKKPIAAAPITLTFPPEEQRRMRGRLQQRNQDHLHVLYASQMAL